MPRRLLITGASIAGNTAALWLAGKGFDVTVVERAPAFRDGGQNVDVRGVGREVLRRMGLEEAALALHTGEEGTAWVERDGSVAAEFRTDELGADGPTAELEILRGDLARLLYERAREHASYRFGEHVTAIAQTEESVRVTFDGGAQERFDAVLVAEGVGSSTRELVFAGDNDPKWMDLTVAYFTIARTASDDQMWRWYHAPGGRSVSLRPDCHGTTRALLSVHKAPGEEVDWDEHRQKSWLREQFGDAGWEAARVLEGLEGSPDFYFDVLRQVRLPRWFDGRLALVGDAAWCATPIAGVGATLALTGGYVLAEELSRSDDVSVAFERYERAMRPMVEEAQGVPKIGPRLMNPQSRLGIHLLHGMLNLASSPPLRELAARLFTRARQEPDLSRYDAAPGRSGESEDQNFRQ